MRMLAEKESFMSAFTQKVAIISGASSGIGAATAVLLAAQGARVFGLGRSAAGLAQTQQTIREGGGEMLAYTCDITQPEACREAVSQCQNALGKVDILINCAGRHVFRPLASISDADWQHDLATNLGGAFALSQAAMPDLLQTSGCIVNVGSLASVEGQAYSATYCAAKHGLIGMTRALALEFAHSDVRINALCPGGTETPQVFNMAFPDGADMDLIMRTAGVRPMSKPEDIAQSIAFLAGPQAVAVHGTVLMADRGKTAG